MTEIESDMLVYHTEVKVADGVVQYTFGHMPSEDKHGLAPQLVWRSIYYPPRAIFNKPNDEKKCHSFLVQLVTAAGLISFAQGVLLASFHLCLEHIAWELHFCTAEEPNECMASFISHVFLTNHISAGVGALIAGRWLRRRSRRKLIIVVGILLSFACLCSCIADAYLSILWAQFLTGIASGLESMCIPLYIAELSPRRVRGRYGVTRSLSLALGVLTGACLTMPLHVACPIPFMKDDQLNIPASFTSHSSFARVWRHCVPAAALPPLLIALYLWIVPYTYETPVFYIQQALASGIDRGLLRSKVLYDEQEESSSDLMKSNGGENVKMLGHQKAPAPCTMLYIHKADLMMRSILNTDDVREELHRLARTFREYADYDAFFANREPRLWRRIDRLSERKSANTEAQDSSNNGKWSRSLLIIACLLALCSVTHVSGLIVVTMDVLIGGANMADSLAAIVLPLLVLNYCIFTAPALLLIESMGRKAMLIVGGIAAGTGALICSLPPLVISSDGATRTLVVLGYLIFFSSASLLSGPALSVYLCEIFPSNIRTSALSIAVCFVWLSDIGVVLISTFLGTQMLFLYLAVLSFGSACLAGLRVVIESKGSVLGAIYTI